MKQTREQAIENVNRYFDNLKPKGIQPEEMKRGEWYQDQSDGELICYKETSQRGIQVYCSYFLYTKNIFYDVHTTTSHFIPATEEQKELAFEKCGWFVVDRFVKPDEAIFWWDKGGEIVDQATLSEIPLGYVGDDEDLSQLFPTREMAEEFGRKYELNQLKPDDWVIYQAYKEEYIVKPVCILRKPVTDYKAIKKFTGELPKNK